MDENFEMAVVIKTGEKRPIPKHWFDHPVIGKDFKRPPSTRNNDDAPPSDADVVVPDGDPTVEWTVPQLTKYATVHGIDVGDAKKKADVLEAITTTSAEPGDTNTPAAGGEQEN